MSGNALIGPDNTTFDGGGVSVAGGTFTMSGGAISGNTASGGGGGVFVSSNATFTKESGGIIYGWDESSGLENSASNGHAVYVASSPAKLRNSTAGEGVTLDSAASGPAGGWVDPMPTTSLQALLGWLASNAVAGGEYAITLSKNESMGPTTLSYSGKAVSISISGGNMEHTISLSSSGSLFTVGSGVTLTLGNNVTLQGLGENTAPLVLVNSGGTLAMETGSKITGNRNYSSSSNGGGVSVSGTFTMSGGAISGNRASSYGGGAYVSSGGTFTKQSGGVIYGSDVDTALKNIATNDNGNAVYVASSPAKQRNTTAGEGVALDSATSGSAGGWE
jgi:hypothetical protein